MATEVDRLVVTLEARMGRYEAEMRRASQMTGQKLTQMEGRFALFARNLKGSASTAALGVGSALGGIGAYLGVQQLQSYADGWTTITRALTASEQAFGMRLRSAEELNKLANESRVDNEAYAKLYIRTAAATRDLGVAESDVAKVTTSVAQALKLGSASASEQASTMLQLSQAFQKGKLDGDEFRTVMENAGIIQELLADKLKVSKGAIINMAAEGKIKVGQLFAALLEGGDKINRIFQQMPVTIDEAFTVLKNSIEQYIGKLNESSGASKAFVDLLASMSRNMETVGDAAFTLGAALLTTFGGSALSGILSIASRLATLPALLAGGATAAIMFGDTATLNLDTFNDRLRQGADLATAMHGALADGANGATTVADQFKALGIVIGQDLLGAVNSISQALVGQAVNWDQIKAAGLIAIGAIVGGVKGMYHALQASFTAIPAIAEVAFKSMANKAIEGIQFMINKVTAGINVIIRAFNMLPSSIVIKTPELVAPSLGKFNFDGARDALAKAGADLDRQLAADFDLPAFGRRVQEEANQIAFERLKAGFAPKDAPTAKPVYPGSPDTGKGKKSPFAREVRQVEESIRALQLENQLLGANAFEAERARTAQELLNAAKREGIKVTPQLLAQIDQLSIAYATAKTEAERLKETFEEIKSFSADALKGFITDLKEGKSGSEALGGALDKLANKLIDMAVNQLVNQALGPLLGGIMGGASSNGAVSALSVFGFANGGIAAHGRPQPLQKFASGGISRSAAIFGEAGPEAAVPLPNGRSIPVDLRLPKLPPVAGMGRPDRSEMVVRVVASSEFDAKVEAVAGNVVARAAPEIMKASVGATEKALPGMIGRAQKRKM